MAYQPTIIGDEWPKCQTNMLLVLKVFWAAVQKLHLCLVPNQNAREEVQKSHGVYMFYI